MQNQFFGFINLKHLPHPDSTLLLIGHSVSLIMHILVV